MVFSPVPKPEKEARRLATNSLFRSLCTLWEAPLISFISCSFSSFAAEKQGHKQSSMPQNHVQLDEYCTSHLYVLWFLKEVTIASLFSFTRSTCLPMWLITLVSSSAWEKQEILPWNLTQQPKPSYHCVVLYSKEAIKPESRLTPARFVEVTKALYIQRQAIDGQDLIRPLADSKFITPCLHWVR